MHTFMVLIATCLKIGHIKYAKGTFGSLLAIPFFFICCKFPIVVQILIFLLLFILGIKSSSYYEVFYNKKDPGDIVIDEFTAYFFILISIKVNFFIILLSFILFRIFDIIKCYPINKVENIKDGLGVMLDDIIAAFYTLIIMLIVCRLL